MVTPERVNNTRDTLLASRSVQDPEHPIVPPPRSGPDSVPWNLDAEEAPYAMSRYGSPPPARKSFGILRQGALIVCVAATAAFFTIEFYPQARQPTRSPAPNTDAKETPAAANSGNTRLSDSNPRRPDPVVPRAVPTPLALPTAEEASLLGAAIVPPAVAPPAVAPPAVTTAALSSPLQPAGPAVRGVTDTEILFGMSSPFTGAIKENGLKMKLGVETAFKAVNDAGGVYGRKLRLIALDDGYEPTRTVETMKQLYEKEQVFGIIGNVGTPTAAVAAPYALDRKMMFFGAFTGSDVIRRDPPDRYVFNYRVSYAEETDAVVRYLVKVRQIRPEQIAVFAQQDSFGDSGFAGVAKAMRTLRSGDAGAILRLNYKRNTVDVDDAVAHLHLSRIPIKAVVMVATYRAAAKFIEKTRPLAPDMIYTDVSGVGSTALADELMLLGPTYADGIIVTQAVPSVGNSSSTVLEYKAALAKYFPAEAPDYTSLEGYVAANIMAEALKRTGPQLDTERLVQALEDIHNFDMGLGTLISFGRSEHQGSHKVWGTQLDQAGHYQAIDLQ
jgi:branched-chain amino acid transport system substrate-binding protein